MDELKTLCSTRMLQGLGLRSSSADTSQNEKHTCAGGGGRTRTAALRVPLALVPRVPLLPRRTARGVQRSRRRCLASARLPEEVAGTVAPGHHVALVGRLRGMGGVAAARLIPPGFKSVKFLSWPPTTGGGWQGPLIQ
jgi:hypothetical protein